MAGYYEIIVRGDDRDLIPFLAGYAAGCGMSGIYFAHEAGLHLKPLRERIKHHGEVSHVLCPDSHRAKLRQAIAAAAPRFQFEIRDESRIERAYFHFDFDTPSRKVAEDIKRILAALPAGVASRDYKPEEIVHPDAKGAEVYSPAHEYVFRGKGVLEGDVGGVIEARARLSGIEFVRCAEIDLHRS
jgi:hypothetical protein